MIHLPISHDGRGKRPNILIRYVSRFDEREVLRWAFRGLLVGVIAVLLLDLREIYERRGLLPNFLSAPSDTEPLLPPLRKGAGIDQGNHAVRESVTTAEALLAQPMRFSLESGGRLVMTGKIAQGTAERFAEEIAARGEYVKVVELASSGGALEDAMAMARLIRERGYATRVANGGICASSCPLIFAGGESREAGDKAAIAVHQFYAAAGGPDDAASALSNAQTTTARISRFLIEMGIDPVVWLHALDTPPQALYYFSQEELAKFNFVTTPGPVASRK